MTAVLDQARDLVAKRLSELEGERQRLERALAGLGDHGAVRSSAGRGIAKRRQPRKGANRRDQILKAVHDANDGIGGGEIAAQIGIKPNYVYRILAELNKSGAVRKEGRQYLPA
jgi:hypothetical protein